jgi:hypothetical protein
MEVTAMEQRDLNLWLLRVAIGVAIVILGFGLLGIGYSVHAALVVLVVGCASMLAVSLYAYATRAR